MNKVKTCQAFSQHVSILIFDWIPAKNLGDDNCPLSETTKKIPAITRGDLIYMNITMNTIISNYRLTFDI